MSTADAERIYRIPARTIRRWHAEGRITDPVTVQGRAMWNPDEIEQMVAHRAGRKRLARVERIAG